MPLTTRSRSVAFRTASRTRSVGLITLQRCLAPLLAFAIACGGDENPTPTPPGAASTELDIPGAAVVIGVGDIAVCGTPGDEATGALVDSVMRVDSAQLVQDLVITLGDNAYPSGPQGVANDFPRCFSPSWGRPRIMRAIRPSPGNHDYDSGTGDPYFQYFGARAGPAGKGYYSFDVGQWHFLSLNSELYFEAGTAAQAKAQEDWLRDDLQRHRALCTAAYFHRPLFGSAAYGGIHEVKPLWDIMYAAGVDLVLNGHEHNYERFRPQTPAGVSDSARGIVEIVVGTGGGALRTIDQPYAANSDARIQGRFGVLKLVLGNGEYRHSFIEAGGRVWDAGSGRCH
jgi:hypothetical protein